VLGLPLLQIPQWGGGVGKDRTFCMTFSYSSSWLLFLPGNSRVVGFVKWEQGNRIGKQNKTKQKKNWLASGHFSIRVKTEGIYFVDSGRLRSTVFKGSGELL
jgi:hypothetical protein